MKIRCVDCQTGFRVDPKRIKVNGSMVRCLKCSYIFMVYPPDFCGSPVTQDTNVEQTILDELLEMQKEPLDLVCEKEASNERTLILADNLSPKEHVSEEELNPDDAEYAQLPDLSELEKLIDWDDKDNPHELENSPAKSDYNFTDTQELDINRI